MGQPASLSRDCGHQTSVCSAAVHLIPAWHWGTSAPLQEATPGTPAKVLGALSVCSTPALTRSVLQTGRCAGREVRQVSWEERLPVCRRSPPLRQALRPSHKPGWDRSVTMCLLAPSPARAPLLPLLLEALRLLPHRKVRNYAPGACCRLGWQFLSPWCPRLCWSAPP